MQTVRKSFKYRLYPDKQAEHTVYAILEACRELYNAALQVRKDAYRVEGKTLTHHTQWREAREIYLEMTEDIPRFSAHAYYEPLRRLDKAFQGFFRRVNARKKGDKSSKPGFPRYQGPGRFTSIIFPDTSGWKLIPPKQQRKSHNDGILLLTETKHAIKIRLHRPMEGDIKTFTIKREGNEWYAVFSCVVSQELQYKAEENKVGIDVGITHYAALSNGTFIDNPRYFRKAEQKLAKRQQELARKKKGSGRWRKAKRAVAQAHKKIRRQRNDFSHKRTRELADQYSHIYVEKLQVKNLLRRPEPKLNEETGTYEPNGAAAKSGLNKSIADAGWGKFLTQLQYKAEWAGATVVKVNPRGTSQRCSRCGEDVKKDLSERWHECPSCGLSVDRDTNSALEILRLGQQASP